MKKHKFQSYKLADKISLNPFITYFPSLKKHKGGEWIFLGSAEIEQVLKYYVENKYVYIYPFGSVTFVNFEHNEVLSFISFLKTIVEKVQDSYLFSFQESYTVNIDPEQSANIENNFPLLPADNETAILGVASILAKSTALNKIEADVETFLEKYEYFIRDLKKGRLFTRRKQIIQFTTQMINFELKVVSNIKIFDRPFTDHNQLLEEYYDRLSQLYELSQRFTIIKDKLEDLEVIKSTFYKLSIDKATTSLYLAEIFLLTVFAIADIIFYLADPSTIINAVKSMF